MNNCIRIGICEARTYPTYNGMTQWAVMETSRECCRCSTHTSLPLQRWEATYTQELPLHLPIPGGSMWRYDPAKYNTHSLRTDAAIAAASAGLPTDTIQKLGRWRSKAYQTYTRHPLTHPSDTRPMATQ